MNNEFTKLEVRLVQRLEAELGMYQTMLFHLLDIDHEKAECLCAKCTYKAFKEKTGLDAEELAKRYLAKKGIKIGNRYVAVALQAKEGKADFHLLGIAESLEQLAEVCEKEAPGCPWHAMTFTDTMDEAGADKQIAALRLFLAENGYVGADNTKLTNNIMMSLAKILSHLSQAEEKLAQETTNAV